MDDLHACLSIAASPIISEEPPQVSPKLFSHRIPIRFTHTDPAGFVFFPRFFEMYQAVLEDWFTEFLGFRYADIIQQRRLGTPVVHIESRFLAPCKLGDYLDIEVSLRHLGNSSFRLCFSGTVAGELRLEAISSMVMISLDDGRPRPIPSDIRASMEAYKALDG
jgi:4-hydroxybenzoyl-CoA thioesterase